ncbi:hypothetical protein DFH27DRAFT_523704 [Peziza echinospora]|nr:hypothetical protein DFH27DRAFT_523704 [Peziza echinospora]
MPYALPHAQPETSSNLCQNHSYLSSLLCVIFLLLFIIISCNWDLKIDIDIWQSAYKSKDRYRYQRYVISEHPDIDAWKEGGIDTGSGREGGRQCIWEHPRNDVYVTFLGKGKVPMGGTVQECMHMSHSSSCQQLVY